VLRQTGGGREGGGISKKTRRSRAAHGKGKAIYTTAKRFGTQPGLLEKTRAESLPSESLLDNAILHDEDEEQRVDEEVHSPHQLHPREVLEIVRREL
jgi:hypothetical protein